MSESINRLADAVQVEIDRARQEGADTRAAKISEALLKGSHHEAIKRLRMAGLIPLSNYSKEVYLAS